MIAGFQRYRKVAEAVSSKDEPVAVYLLEELATMCHTSPEDAQYIADSLIRSLENRSPVTKAKALKSMKYICSKGCVDFQRALQRQAGVIRPLQHHQGVPDQLKGDALNERVRTSAKEAIEVIFDSTIKRPQALQGTGPTSVQSRPNTFGAHGLENGTHRGSAPSTRMVGFGSDQFSASQNRFLPGGGFRPAPLALAQSVNLKSRPWQRSSLLDSSPIDADPGPGLPSATENGLAVGTVRVKHESVLGNEEELVDRICEPGGVRLQPAKDDLRRFIDTVGSLNGKRIAAALENKMESGTWQECFRALCALEGILQYGSSVSCGEIGVHFQINTALIETAKQSMQNTVRGRAHKVLVLLGLEDETPSRTPHSSAPSRQEPPLIGDILGDEKPTEGPQTQTQASVDLMDALVDPAAPTTPTNASSAAGTPGEVSLFDGLGVSVEPQPQPPSLQPRALNLSAAPAQVSMANTDSNTIQQQQPVNELDSLFSGLSVDNAGTNTSVPHNVSNPALAALMAPPPPSDPFPEALAPLEPEHLPQPSQGPAAAAGAMPVGLGPMVGISEMQAGPAGVMVNMMGSTGQQVGVVQIPGGGMMPQIGQMAQIPQIGQMPQIMPGMVPQGMMPQMGWLPGVQPMMPTGMPVVAGAASTAGLGDSGGRSAVPLSAFMGPAHIKRDSPGGKQNAAFNFIGEHVSALRSKET